MKFKIGLLALILILFSPTPAYAVCPVCTIAVGAGLGISRYLGIDDTVSSIWIGGLILSSSFWLNDFFKKRNWYFPQMKLVTTFLFYLLTLLPLYLSKMIGLPGNTLYGIDKVLLGIIVGTGVFLIGIKLDQWLRQRNNGRVYVAYQKVLAPVSLLSTASLLLYFVTLGVL